jgi:hypothetical protein
MEIRIDDTTTSEVLVIDTNQLNKVQFFADEIVQWSTNNKMKLNTDKCKELRISFAKNPREFSPVIIVDKRLEVVNLWV